MMKKILLVGPCPKDEVSGAGMGFQSLVDGFEKTVFPFAVVDSVRGGSQRKIGVFSLRRVWYSILIVLSAWRKMFHSHTVYMTVSCSSLGFLRDFFIIWGASILRKRVLLHLHGGGYKKFYESQARTYQRVIKRTLACATHIIVLGELLRRQFDFVPGVEKKIKVVPNGLPKGLRRDCCKKTLPEKGQKVRLLYLSNLLPSKGYLDLLEACARLKRQGFRDFVCDFCGEFVQTVVDRDACILEEQRKDFYQRISTYKLENHVIYHGTVRGKQKEELLRQAHIFILPTYYPWEGQPISIIEALAFATPVISTRNNGIPEEVIEGYNGLFVEPRNPADIARAINQIIADKSKYAEMSRNAHKYFEKKFTSEVHLSRMMEVICGTF